MSEDKRVLEASEALQEMDRMRMDEISERVLAYLREDVSRVRVAPDVVTRALERLGEQQGHKLSRMAGVSLRVKSDMGRLGYCVEVLPVSEASRQNHSPLGAEFPSSIAPPKDWSQQMINEWGERVFGQMRSHPMTIFRKFHGEMSETLDAVALWTGIGQEKSTADLSEDQLLARERDLHADLRGELADLQVLLYQLAGRCGVNLAEATNEKMNRNEKRQWNVTADGIGQHVSGT